MAIITDPDWIDPEETTFDVEKPIRSEQGVMLAGNPIAAFQGKPGAPGLNFRALEQLAAGDVTRLGMTATISTSGTDLRWNPFGGVFGFMQRGTVRVSFEAWGGGALNLNRFRYGSITVISTWSLSGSATMYETDVPVLPGDSIFVEIPYAGGFGNLRNCYFKTDGQNIWRVMLIGIDTLDFNDYG